MNEITIAKLLKEKRGNISESSIKTYTSVLKSLYKKVFPEDKEMNVDKFSNYEKILNYLNDKPYNSRKTILSALYVATNNDHYQKQMMEDIKKYNDEMKTQTMSQKQEANWVTQDEIRSVFNKYQTNAEFLIKESKHRELTPKEFQLWQDYIILALSSGIFIPPERVRDWTSFKIRNIDTEKDNYLEGKGNKRQLVFNSYKTAKFYGTRKMNCPKELLKILDAFIPKVKSDYLLNTSAGKPLSQVLFTQKLNNIFKKNVSVNILRHSYLTSRFQEGKISLQELTDTANAMSHSLTQSLEYVKLNKPNEESKVETEPEPVSDSDELTKVSENEIVKKKRGRPRKKVE